MELNTIVNQIIQNTKWKSKSRIIGEACEIYVKSNIKCTRCAGNNFEKCKTNEKSKDIICKNCNQKFQIKAKKFTKKDNDDVKNSHTFKTIGGDYNTTISNLHQNIDYIIVQYDKNTNHIKNILYIPFENINTTNILQRKPLGPNAKRAGWQGCYFMFSNVQLIS